MNKEKQLTIKQKKNKLAEDRCFFQITREKLRKISKLYLLDFSTQKFNSLSHSDLRINQVRLKKTNEN